MAEKKREKAKRKERERVRIFSVKTRLSLIRLRGQDNRQIVFV